MEQGVIDENASSRKLKQQMERIKEKSESVNVRGTRNTANTFLGFIFGSVLACCSFFPRSLFF